jgi:hypothetical protein
VDHGDGLGSDALDLAFEPGEVDRPAPLDGEFRHLGADARHDLAHEHPEHARHDHEHAVARLDDRDGPRLESGTPGARHHDHLARGRLEHVAEREGGRLEHLEIEPLVVLDGRRLVHRLDDRPGELGRAGDHEHGARGGGAPLHGGIHGRSSRGHAPASASRRSLRRMR